MTTGDETFTKWDFDDDDAATVRAWRERLTRLGSLHRYISIDGQERLSWFDRLVLRSEMFFTPFLVRDGAGWRGNLNDPFDCRVRLVFDATEREIRDRWLARLTEDGGQPSLADHARIDEFVARGHRDQRRDPRGRDALARPSRDSPPEEAVTRRKRGRGLGTLYRRPGSPNWWVQYSVGKKQVRESTGTPDEDAARDWLRARQAQIERGAAPQPRRTTVSDLASRLERAYRNEEDPSPGRAERYAARVGQYYAHLRAFFGDTKPVKDIRLDDIEDYVEHRRRQGAKASTIRSEVRALGRGLRPTLRRAPTLPTIRVKNARAGFFTNAEMARLLPCLPEYMRPFTEAGYITGWRRGELRGLRWSDVDWERGVIRLLPGTTKNDEGREFPFTAHPRLKALLRERRALTSVLEKTTGSICAWVFWHRTGRQIAWFYDGWQTACEKAGVPGRLFHDLRRSAVRNLIDAGVPQSVAMTITGHKTAAVFRRYEIRDNADVVAAVTKLAAFHSAPAPDNPRVLPLRPAEPEAGAL